MPLDTWPFRNRQALDAPALLLLPPKVEQCAEVAEAAALVREVRAQAVTASQALTQVEIELYERRDHEHLTDALQRDAEALLRGESMPPALDLVTRHKQLSRDVDVLNRALGLATDALTDAREARSRDYRLAAMPEHRAAVRRIAHLTALLLAANEDERSLHRRLVEAGCVLSDDLPQMAQPHATPGVWSAGCAAEVWLETARRRGFLGLGEDPAAEGFEP